MPIKARFTPNRKHMTIHLVKFVDRVRGHEARGARDFVMTMSDAQDLHADITRLLADLHDLRNQIARQDQQEIIQIEIGGGTF
jgi:hypothetical protein